MTEPTPVSAARPDHAWNGDEHGHNCADCPSDSIWKCDRLAHLEPPNTRPSEDMKQRLAAHARARRTTPIPNRSLA